MENGWMELFYQVVQAVLLAALPILAAAVTRWVIGEIERQKTTLDADVLRNLEWIAQIAVHAAEQLNAAGYIADKKVYAMKVGEQWLKDRKISINIGVLESAVEAAILKEFNPQWLGNKENMVVSPAVEISAEATK